MSAVIWWIRRDLRLSDNRALKAALDSGSAVIPLFIFDPALLQGERFGLARLKFMLNGLQALDEALRKHRRRLLIRQGKPLAMLEKLIREAGVQALYFNADYSPYAQKRDAAVAEQLSIPVYSFDDALLHTPNEVLKQDGKPYLIYTPFKRVWFSLAKPEPGNYPIKAAPFHTLDGIATEALPTLHDLGFAETIDVPEAGEVVALRRLERFAESRIERFTQRRDTLDVNPFTDDTAGTSGLSPYFRFGMLSPRQAYAAAAEARRKVSDLASRQSIDVWISELAWRDFYMHTLFHFPHIYNTSFRADYEHIRWRSAPDELQAWKAGRTGYPVIDAAMRQLDALGWMHNRARMIVAAFLTKDLLIYWREGDLHFMHKLIDGDPAANNGGWQWSAGTGKDSQPFFRIFNPVAQSKKFDPQRHYIRHWLPELRDVPDKYIHTPWLMDTAPKNYPPPMVEHNAARERALTAFKARKD
ncbi:MAG: deoxyribodipyrimidine photo-lyase [Chloroflexota bacterium]